MKFLCLQISQKVIQILDRFLPYEARAEICQNFDLKTPKIHSEINWPLHTIQIQWGGRGRSSKSSVVEPRNSQCEIFFLRFCNFFFKRPFDQKADLLFSSSFWQIFCLLQLWIDLAQIDETSNEFLITKPYQDLVD